MKIETHLQDPRITPPIGLQELPEIDMEAVKILYNGRAPANRRQQNAFRKKLKEIHEYYHGKESLGMKLWNKVLQLRELR